MKFLVRGLWILALAILGVAIAAAAFVAVKYKAQPNQLALDRNVGEFSFIWAATTMGGRMEKRSAMLAPVKVAGLSKTFYMQFDLGAQSTVFLGAPIAAIAEKSGKFEVDRRKGVATDVELAVGDMSVTIKSAALRKSNRSQPINWDSDEVVVIGTLGSDFLDGRVLEIDYPERLVRIMPAAPAPLASAPSSAFDYEERRILLHGEFEGEPVRIWFDTGTSAFSLLTDEDTWRRLAKNKDAARSFGVNSWGRVMQMTVAETDAAIKLGGVEIPLGEITSVKGASFAQVAIGHALGIKGLTGNKLLLDKTLVLDALQNRYWVTVDAPAG